MSVVKQMLPRILVLSFFVSLSCLGQSSTELRAELDKLQRQPSALSASLGKLNSDIEAFQRKLEQAELDFQGAKADSQRVSAELDVAKKAHENSPSQDSDRALRKIQHGYDMAERGVKSRQKRVERIQGKYQQAVLEQEKQRQQLAKLKQKISTQRNRLSAAKKAEAAEQEASLAANQLAQAAEQERRSAQAAALEVAEVEAAEAKNAERATRLAQVEAARAEKVETSQTHALKKGAEASASVATEASQPELSTLSDEDKKAQAQALETVTRIKDDIAGKSSRRPLYKRLMLKGNQLESVGFEFMGANYYRAEARVEGGKQQIDVGRNRFVRTIPPADAGEEYVFFYQAKSASRGILSLFKKSLLPAE